MSGSAQSGTIYTYLRYNHVAFHTLARVMFGDDAFRSNSIDKGKMMDVDH